MHPVESLQGSGSVGAKNACDKRILRS